MKLVASAGSLCNHQCDWDTACGVAFVPAKSDFIRPLISKVCFAIGQFQEFVWARLSLQKYSPTRRTLFTSSKCNGKGSEAQDGSRGYGKLVSTTQEIFFASLSKDPLPRDAFMRPRPLALSSFKAPTSYQTRRFFLETRSASPRPGAEIFFQPTSPCSTPPNKALESNIFLTSLFSSFSNALRPPLVVQPGGLPETSAGGPRRVRRVRSSRDWKIHGLGGILCRRVGGAQQWSLEVSSRNDIPS